MPPESQFSQPCLQSSSSLPLAELIAPPFPNRFPSSQVRRIRLDDIFRTGLQASQSVRPFVRYRSPKDSLSPADSSLLVTLRPQQLSFLSSPHVSHFTCMHPRSDAVLCLHRLFIRLFIRSFVRVSYWASPIVQSSSSI